MNMNIYSFKCEIICKTITYFVKEKQQNSIHSELFLGIKCPYLYELDFKLFDVQVYWLAESKLKILYKGICKWYLKKTKKYII